jgi:hypothetical protein
MQNHPAHPPGHFASQCDVNFTAMLICNEDMLVLINRSRVPNEPPGPNSRNKFHINVHGAVNAVVYLK